MVWRVTTPLNDALRNCFESPVFFLLGASNVLAIRHSLSVLLILYLYTIFLPISNIYSNICNCRVIPEEKPHFE